MRGARPLVLGHRGDPRRARENTIAAFGLALAAGADGIEFDVRGGLDEPLVHHEPSLRVGGRRRNVATLGTAGRPIWMPSLADVVAWAAKNDAFLDVEIKEPGAEAAIVRAVQRLRRRCVVTSFHPDVVYQVRAIDPAMRVGWITKSEPDSVAAIAAELRPSIVVLPARRCASRLVLALQGLGCEVWAWNVNTARTAARLHGLGVGGLITDSPRRIVAWRDAHARPQRVPRRGHPGN